MKHIFSGNLKGDYQILGEIRNNNCGTPMKIIRWRLASDIDVEFLDEYYYIKKNITYQNFKRGQVKNPYDRTLVGVGYIGDGEHKPRDTKKKNSSQEYIVWINMMTRCYDKRYKKKYPAYYGLVTVCNEWHNFQKFAQWYNDNYYEIEGRLHIDKDILCPGNSIYQPDKCLLVPQKINEQFHYSPKNDNLPTGIRLTNTCKYAASCNGEHIGTYFTMLEAYDVYAKEKERVIRQIADEFIEIIPTKVYNALYKYKVDIKNDKCYKAA